MTSSLTFSDSIIISASPADVYAIVSDITRTGEWSPVCQECWWDEGHGPRTGAFFTGRNVTPDRTWETRCEITTAEDGVAFGWSVSGGKVNWGYTMTAMDGGTELTESWEFTPDGQAFFVERFGESAPAQTAARVESARTGIPETLSAIKRIIEQT